MQYLNFLQVYENNSKIPMAKLWKIFWMWSSAQKFTIFRTNGKVNFQIIELFTSLNNSTWVNIFQNWTVILFCEYMHHFLTLTQSLKITQNVSFYNNTNCKFKYWNPNSPKIIWKSPKMSHLNFLILAFSTNFCPIEIDLSGNTVWA